MHDDLIKAANKANNQGIEELLAENYLAAIKFFNESMRIIPDNHIAIKNLAAVAAKMGSLEDAESYLLRLKEEDHEAVSLFDLAKILAARNKLAPARLYAKKAYDKDNRDLAIKTFYADIEYRIGDKFISRDLYEQILAENPLNYIAATAFAKAIWAINTNKAVEVLNTLLTGELSNTERRAVLYDLILIKESLERKKYKKASHHANGLEDIQIRYSRNEAKQLIKLSNAYLSKQPNHKGALLHIACASYGLGGLEASSSYFKDFALLNPNHIASSLNINSAFLDTLLSLPEEETLGNLPPIHYIERKNYQTKPVLLIVSNLIYYYNFVKPFIRSLAHRSSAFCIHLHIMDCSDNQASEILEWTSKFSNHNFALSIETSGVDTNDSIALANYYHAIRFVRYYQFRTIYEGPLWLVDADAIINKDPTNMLMLDQSFDIALRVRPGRLEPWNSISAALIGSSAGAGAQKYFYLVASYLSYFYREKKLFWGIDQIALLVALAKYKSIRIKFLSALEQDVELSEEGLIWFVSGVNKYIPEKLRNNPKLDVSKLGEREKKLAVKYRMYSDNN